MNDLTRRRFVTALGASVLTIAPVLVHAGTGPPRILRLDNLHTNEKLSVEYFAAGRYLPDALSAVNHLLRDFRSGAVGTIDPALLDLLHGLAATVGSQRCRTSDALGRRRLLRCIGLREPGHRPRAVLVVDSIRR